MIELTQLILHDPENNKYGDCFRTCVACILEIPDATHVPHFFENCFDDPHLWQQSLNDWLFKRGLAYIEISSPGAEWFKSWGIDTYHIISGYSTRGFGHAVVGRNGKIVWDPHPSRNGLIDRDWAYGMFVKLM